MTTNTNNENTKPASEKSKVEIDELPSSARELNDVEADAVRGGLANRLQPSAAPKGSIIWEC